MKTAPKRAIQKIVEATGDLIDNKISDKITSASKNLLENYKIMKLITKQKCQKEDMYLQKKTTNY